MSNEVSRKTWRYPWSYREGTIVTIAILVLGFALQISTGGLVLRFAGFPGNLISGIAFLVLIRLLFFFLNKHPLIKWLGSVNAALPAIFGFTFLVLLMGFVKQDVKPHNKAIELLGLAQLVKTWPFMLINVYLLVLLGITTLKRLTPFNLKNAGFFLNHFGLFLVLLSTSLGSSDIQTLSMDCFEHQTSNSGRGENGNLVELPFSIKLLNFGIEEFRPKVTIIDNESGKIVNQNNQQLFELLDRDEFKMNNYQVELDTFFTSSGRVGEDYYPVNEPGASPSAKLRVTNLKDQSVFVGWICSGSYAQQPQSLSLGENYSMVMLPAEPKKFSSEVSITTKDGKSQNAVIEVNRPFKIEGWTVYQLGYNKEMGCWSDKSVLQLVRDPWLPVVYAGIFMMMAGAIFLFIFGKPKSGGLEHVA